MRILVVMAHPDDPEFAAGGTIAQWVREGPEVIYCLATRGEKGSDDPTMPPERLAAIREHEQRQAAAVLGVREVIFLNYTSRTRWGSRPSWSSSGKYMGFPAAGKIAARVASPFARGSL